MNEENHLQRAEKLIEINRFREAIPLLTKANTENPQNYRVVCSLSYCFSELNDSNKSMEYAEKAITINPTSEWAYRLKGHNLMRKGNRQEGLEYAQKAVSFAPENYNALSNLIYSLLANDKLQESRQIANKLLRIYPDAAETHYLLGLVEKAFQNYETAEKCFRQALRISPENAKIRNSLALAILKQSDRNSGKKSQKLEYRGLQQLGASVKADPNNREVIENLKDTFDNWRYYCFMVYFLPIFIFGCFVTPIFSVLSYLGILLLFSSFIRDNNRRFKKLSSEMKTLLKVRNYSELVRESISDFFRGGKYFLKMNWLQYSIASVIFLSYLFLNFVAAPASVFWGLSFLFWLNQFWIFRKIVKDGEPPQSSDFQQN